MDPFLTPPEVFVKDYLTSYQLSAPTTTGETQKHG
jgi:hypothetical protein